ncbi:MAG: PcfJ domain-containing protein, partial [Alphaproteobacteria bacterium]|nr:PcfJ domain-containing protein [Alphaproteobacteria bacterium]
ERGDEVVHLRLGATLRKRIDRALAALAAEIEDGTPLSLDRIPFPKAEAKAKKQRRARHVERHKARLSKAAIPVYNALTGETVVRLTTPESLADEGSRMSHCVATYDYWVHRGDCEIYSVRDRDGKSRATVEVDLGDSSSGTVWQIKGFANGPVEPRYRPVLQGFIRSRNYPVEDDQDNLLTDDASFLVDPKQLEQLLVEDGGLAWLRANRFAGYKAMRDAPLGLLLRTIAANAERLPDRVLNEVY